MTLLVDLAVRSSVIALVGLVASACLRRQSAAVRHALLACTLGATLVVVPLSRVLPVWELPLPVRMSAAPSPASDEQPDVVATSGASAATGAHAADGAVPLVWLLWATGFALVMGRLLIGVGRLRSLANRAERLRDARWARLLERVSTVGRVRRPITLLHADAAESLATWGAFRPRVLLPSDAQGWSDERAYVVLCHELAHIRRHDWLVQIGAEAVRAVYWFNPLLWMACTCLRRESEQACDDAVLAGGVTATAYATHLLDLARRYRDSAPEWMPAASMARPSTLERRITAMLNPALDRERLTRRAVAITAVALFGVTLPVAAFRAAQNAPLTLSGSVYDTSGAVLPGVALTLEDAQRVKVPATTDAAGRFEFPAVAPGHYVLEAGLAGFRPLRIEFDLRKDRDWSRAITLQVGSVKETITVEASRPAASRSTATARASAPVRVGGNIRTPRKVHDVRPVYPETMRDAGLEGVVPMEAIIGLDGSVSSLRVLSAEIHPDLAMAAVDAVRQWRFAPTLLNGEPVEVVMTVAVQFKLSD